MILTNQLNNPLVKKHVLIIALGLFLGLLLYNYFGVSISIEEKSYNTPELILSTFGGVLLAYITYYISLKLDDLIPWKSQLVNRFLSGIILLFLASYILISCLVFLYTKFINQNNLDEELYKNNLIKLGIILLILMLIYNIVYFALYSYYTYSILQIDAVKYERKQFDLQLKALKSQLSSHFLFNNLNTISSLAYKDVNQAERYIRGLAKIYDYTLNSYHSKLVTLKEELQIANAYLLLLGTRFGNALNYEIDISETNLKHKIPPLTLQMLIENAAKHNQVSETNPLQIKVYEVNGQLVISNNITTAPKKVNSFNIGLSNINSRFKLIHNKEITIERNGDYKVTIPIINNDE